jgi:serine/threonine-protein phosphatase 2A regulatory subunit B'
MIFLTFVYETEAHYGIAELLEILGSIINGFTLPLKVEHRDFLVQALIPLHKPRSLSTYHPQLSYCVAQYIEKDPTLTEGLFQKIIHFWPITNSGKVLLFLNEVEEILCVVEPDMFVDIQEMLFKKISTCIASTHFQIAEKALTLWNNEYILSLVAENVEVILPIVFPSLYYVARTHWNKAIRSMAYTSLRLFMDIDEVVFGQVIEEYRANRAKELEEREERVKRWRDLFENVEPEKLKPRKYSRQKIDLKTIDEAAENTKAEEDTEDENPEDPMYPHKPKLPEARFDPLLNDNDGLPLSVKIPYHLNQLVEEDFNPEDPVFKELSVLFPDLRFCMSLT